MPPEFPVKLELLYRCDMRRSVWVEKKVAEFLAKFWEAEGDTPCPRMWFQHATGYLLVNMNEVVEIMMPKINDTTKCGG